MIKKTLLGLLVSLSFYMTTTASAENETACKAVICLSGALVGQKGFQECATPILIYGNIRVYDHHKFNESLTALVRDRFLRQCSSADNNYIMQITATYGRIEDVRL